MVFHAPLMSTVALARCVSASLATGSARCQAMWGAHAEVRRTARRDFTAPLVSPGSARRRGRWGPGAMGTRTTRASVVTANLNFPTVIDVPEERSTCWCFYGRSPGYARLAFARGVRGAVGMELGVQRSIDTGSINAKSGLDENKTCTQCL